MGVTPRPVHGKDAHAIEIPCGDVRSGSLLLSAGWCLPETQIRNRFESVSDDELEAYQTVVNDAVGKADQVVGANTEAPPPPGT
jgi:hypothetical protein